MILRMGFDINESCGVFGIYTREEMEDVYGQEKQERKKTVITLDDTQVKVVDDKESAE